MLAEKNLTLTHAIKLAQGMEAAEKNAQSFKGTEAIIQKIRQSATPRGAGASNPQQIRTSLAIGMERRIIHQQIVVWVVHGAVPMKC